MRHVLGLSGGKDSAALAIYLRGKVPQMEYFFCDTGAELAETYAYLDKLEAYLGKPIVRLNSGRTFEHWMELYRGTLPSPQMRWCTKNMKLKPLEAWLADDPALSYVAIRADEHREGYISTKDNLTSVFPFREDGIDMEGVKKILDNSGLGLPAYYEWRSRSGCYFCFFQRKAEWVRLAERHPDDFQKAVAIENGVRYAQTAMQGRQYTWSQGETLEELIARKEDILREEQERKDRDLRNRKRIPLVEALASPEADEEDQACLICHL